MLSKDKPESNILLERKLVRNQYRGSQQVPTSGENWMEPFSLILGLSSDEFRPWKQLFFGNNESTLLVEGLTDKEYFEMLRSSEHGENALQFEGSVFNYDGFGALKNSAMLKFINNRSKASFITYDLDIEKEVKTVLEKNGFIHKVDFTGLGINKPGMRSIEGLGLGHNSGHVRVLGVDHNSGHPSNRPRHLARNRLIAQALHRCILQLRLVLAGFMIKAEY
jgi:putative ATP-dependent endonuclease of OLD family